MVIDRAIPDIIIIIVIWLIKVPVGWIIVVASWIVGVVITTITIIIIAHRQLLGRTECWSTIWVCYIVRRCECSR